MNTIYFDNAATTPIISEVIEVVSESMRTNFGNPSSTHKLGRTAKSAVETVRKTIAKYLNVSSSEIIFTAGGSEADNLILRNAVVNLGVRTIISSKIEHHAVLHTIAQLKRDFDIQVLDVNVDEFGVVDYNHLVHLMSNAETKVLVSLMYINNEIGTLLDLKKIGGLCEQHGALFHSDTVQGVAHFKIDLKETPVDFMVASAHKFHGPKGVGFAYVKKGFGIAPILHGGEQEKGARAGTENVHSIVGMGSALQLGCDQIAEETIYIQSLKDYFIAALNSNFEGIAYNGNSDDAAKTSHIILNVRFPKNYAMMLFNLDLKGIAASGGSACQSGSNKGSHVLNTILSAENAEKTSVRFSFSKLNTTAEIDTVIEVLKGIINK
ncbi:MAG: cysteine desulfurase [Flavobacteriaceae bacterium]|nr:MAG: cysteine desulfurase [Flavobacteriaceae bacterium]